MQRGYLQLIILKLISEKPSSGYDLLKEIQKRLKWKPSTGSLYPILETLEKEKKLKSKQDKRRKVYSLTQQGIQILSISQSQSDYILDSIKESILLYGMISEKDVTQILRQVEEQ